MKVKVEVKNELPPSEHATVLSGVLAALVGTLTGIALMAVTLRPAYAIVPNCIACTLGSMSAPAALQPLAPSPVSPTAQAGLQLSGKIAQIFAQTFSQELTANLADQLAQFTPMGLLRQSMSAEQRAEFDRIPEYDASDLHRVISPTIGQVDARFGAGEGGDSAERIGQMMRANAFPGVFDVPGVIDAARLGEQLSSL